MFDLRCVKISSKYMNQASGSSTIHVAISFQLIFDTPPRSMSLKKKCADLGPFLNVKRFTSVSFFIKGQTLHKANYIKRANKSACTFYTTELLNLKKACLSLNI